MNISIHIINFLFNLLYYLVNMQTRSQFAGGLLNQMPQPIKDSAFDIAKVSMARFSRVRNRSSKPYYFLKGNPEDPSYQQAKKAETSQRNLIKALTLYAKSASEGDRIDSCIKDFASVLHQMGYTKQAVEFLASLRSYYQGDLNKYDRLASTLQRQLTPSGKHECKSLLFELPNKQKPTKEFIESLFENISRIKIIKVFNHLALTEPSEEVGKWLFFEFESFSAAKKTLEKFKFDEWFGINRFWVRGGLITCQANDGREDFEKGLVVTKKNIEENIGRYWSYETIRAWDSAQTEHYYNECAKTLIENDLAVTSFEDESENIPQNCFKLKA